MIQRQQQFNELQDSCDGEIYSLRYKVAHYWNLHIGIEIRILNGSFKENLKKKEQRWNP